MDALIQKLNRFLEIQRYKELFNTLHAKKFMLSEKQIAYYSAHAYSKLDQYDLVLPHALKLIQLEKTDPTVSKIC